LIKNEVIKDYIKNIVPFYKIFQEEFSGISGPLNLSNGSLVLIRQSGTRH
tara:strand:+ start:557 stop:706 length:150 start_codon:yes stop_codon:yes gene_type:complete